MQSVITPDDMKGDSKWWLSGVAIGHVCVTSTNGKYGHGKCLSPFLGKYFGTSGSSNWSKCSHLIEWQNEHII